MDWQWTSQQVMNVQVHSRAHAACAHLAIAQSTVCWWHLNKSHYASIAGVLSGAGLTTRHLAMHTWLVILKWSQISQSMTHMVRVLLLVRSQLGRSQGSQICQLTFWLQLVLLLCTSPYSWARYVLLHHQQSSITQCPDALYASCVCSCNCRSNACCKEPNHEHQFVFDICEAVVELPVVPQTYAQCHLTKGKRRSYIQSMIC